MAVRPITYHKSVSSMTDNQLSSRTNPHCDGEYCISPSSRVRIIKIDDSTNADLCRVCHAAYVEEGLDDVPFSIFPSLLSQKEWGPKQ